MAVLTLDATRLVVDKDGDAEGAGPVDATGTKNGMEGLMALFCVAFPLTDFDGDLSWRVLFNKLRE